MNLYTDVDSGIGINLELVAAVLRDQKEPHRSRIILVSGSEFSTEIPFSEVVTLLSGARDRSYFEKESSPVEGRWVGSNKSEATPLGCDGRAGSSLDLGVCGDKSPQQTTTGDEMGDETSDIEPVTIFGKKMDPEAVEFLIRVIGNSLNVVAEHGIKNGWDEERIKAATKTAAVGIAWGFKSLVYGAKEYPQRQETSGSAP